MQKFSIKEALTFGFDIAKKRIWLFIPVLLIMMAIQMPLQYMSSREELASSGEYWIVYLLTMIVQIIVSLGLIRIALNLFEKKEARISDLFSEYQKFFRYLGAQIIVGIIVVFGLLLLIVPGIIWAIKYSYTQYLIVDKNMGVFEALGKSGEITQGNRWHLFLFALASIGVTVLGALALGIGLFWAIPTTFMANVFIYKKLLDSKKKNEPETK